MTFNRVEIPAEPEPIVLDLDRTALVIVDMQNAFASPGGMLDLAGIDVGPARDAVSNARLVCDEARGAGVAIIYLTIGWPADGSTAGGPDSPNPRKELALRLMSERPELRGRLLTFGTWDFQIVDALAPQPGDVVIVKPRYSGFHGTDLHGRAAHVQQARREEVHPRSGDLHALPALEVVQRLHAEDVVAVRAVGPLAPDIARAAEKYGLGDIRPAVRGENIIGNEAAEAGETGPA